MPALQEGASMQVRGPPISERHGLNPKTQNPNLKPSTLNLNRRSNVMETEWEREERAISERHGQMANLGTMPLRFRYTLKPKS